MINVFEKLFGERIKLQWDDETNSDYKLILLSLYIYKQYVIYISSMIHSWDKLYFKRLEKTEWMHELFRDENR